MNIRISYGKQSFPASMAVGDTLALYSVPTSYSADGLYLSRWATSELEPVPACDGVGFLLKLRLETEQNEVEVLREIYKAEGVDYAEI